MNAALRTITQSTVGTEFENRIYLVGGYLRDLALGLPAPAEIDMVVEGDAPALATMLHRAGCVDFTPVIYPRFGTALVMVQGFPVELVTARAESYDAATRKPNVEPATLRDDIYRRDFTVNTLLRNIHSGVELDVTGLAHSDLAARVLRTPVEPNVTFYDDPLRMLRAVRFAVKLGFTIHSDAWAAICKESHRLNLLGPGAPVVSGERIRDEFLKIMVSAAPALGLELLMDSGLLAQFAPEVAAMRGVTQNQWHAFDVWDHTLAALRQVEPGDSLELRLAVLLHDVGKPLTRTEDERGIHFYQHQHVGAAIARSVLGRLRCPNDQIAAVGSLVEHHMRLGELGSAGSDAAIRRLIRAVGDQLDQLFALARYDHAALRADAPASDLTALRERVDAVNAEFNAAKLVSPLTGTEIMDLLDIPPGPKVAQVKEFLINEVLEGRLKPDDREGAVEAIKNYE